MLFVSNLYSVVHTSTELTSSIKQLNFLGYCKLLLIMAEGGYYNMKYYSGDRANKIEEEVRGSLFRLPNEEEIENEMKEVENMKKLDAEYQQKKQEFER